MILNYIPWNPAPEIVNIFGISIRSYGLLFVCGLILCIYILGWIFKREKIQPENLEKSHPLEMILPVTFPPDGGIKFRVVHPQYQDSPFSFPNYATSGNNDRWIAIQNFEGEDWTIMVQLWKYSLLHFCHVINNVNGDKLGNEWIAGPGKNITLHSMIVDFPVHLKLHLNEINNLINSQG